MGTSNSAWVSLRDMSEFKIQMLPAIQAAQSGPVIVIDIMRRIREELRGVDREQDWKRYGRKAVPPHLIASVQRLRSSTAMLRSAIARIGEPPPGPPTVRARLGLHAVHAIRRALFWVLPPIQSAQNQIVDALEQHLAATEQILQILQQTNAELARTSHLLANQQSSDKGSQT
jgi:hypothetical protein